MMRLAKTIATVSMALTLAFAIAASAQAQTPAAKPTAPQAKPAAKPAAAPVKPAATAVSPAKTPATAKVAPAKPVAVKSAAAVKPATAIAAAAKPAAKQAAGKVAQAEPKPSATTSTDQAPVAEPAGPKRDPFVSLVNDRKDSGPALPPGKAGLVVATVRVDGTVKSGSELLAVVSNPERHVYFVRPGDQLYDGTVERIDLDGVTFHENSKDAFGKPVVREVTKRIYASAGEQQ